MTTQTTTPNAASATQLADNLKAAAVRRDKAANALLVRGLATIRPYGLEIHDAHHRLADEYRAAYSDFSWALHYASEAGVARELSGGSFQLL